MTRINTSGFSLKVISAKLQRLLSSNPYRIAGCGFLLAVLLHSLLSAGCARGAGGGGGGGGLEVDGFVFKGEEMEGVRFVPGEIDSLGNFIPLDMRLNVLTMQGLRWHSIWASKHPNQLVAPPAPPDPRLLWSKFEYIGGDEMVVGGAAHAGRNNFVAVAIRNGQFYINRNAG